MSKKYKLSIKMGGFENDYSEVKIEPVNRLNLNGEEESVLFQSDADKTATINVSKERNNPSGEMYEIHLLFDGTKVVFEELFSIDFFIGCLELKLDLADLESIPTKESIIERLFEKESSITMLVLDDGRVEITLTAPFIAKGEFVEIFSMKNGRFENLLDLSV